MFVGCHVDDSLRESMGKFGKKKILLEIWNGGRFKLRGSLAVRNGDEVRSDW